MRPYARGSGGSADGGRTDGAVRAAHAGGHRSGEGEAEHPPPLQQQHVDAGGRPQEGEGALSRLLASPYARLMRLEKPAGTLLLFWPCAWSIALAAPSGCAPDATLLALFGAGAVLLRGAGCTVNDLWDRDLDARVERTRTRPLAAGEVTPLAATAFLGAQLLAGLQVLLQLNDFSKLLGASSLLLVGTYPLMKRVIDWPQAFLGLTINWGALLGWAAVHGELDASVVLPLYAGSALWTLYYDTVYAHQDRKDDEVVGVLSSARALGAAGTPPALAAFAAGSGALLAAAGGAAGLDGGAAAAAYGGGLAASGALVTTQLARMDVDDRAQCAEFFNQHAYFVGPMVFAGAVAGKLLA